MEEFAWKKDTTPYILFQCTNCNQYIYVKTIQKTKKCLRCGKVHRVEQIRDNGEVIYGISNAVERLRKRQNELARKELGGDPDLRAYGDFKVADSLLNSKEEYYIKEHGNKYLEKFKKLLIKLSSLYLKFPLYVIEVMTEKFKIPHSECKILTRDFIKRGIIVKVNSNFYRINLEKLL